MQVQFDQDFGPEALLGNGTAGILFVDETGAVSLFNRQAARLLGLAPERTIGAAFSSIVASDEVVRWLADGSRDSRPLFLYVNGRPLDLIQAEKTIGQTNIRLVTVKDASRRRNLETKSLEFEMGLGEAQSDWGDRLKASSLLHLLRDYAIDPSSLSGVWEMGKRTGQILFPKGGAIFVLSNGQYRPQSTWGELTDSTPFQSQSCLARPDSPSRTCLHFPVGARHLCTEIEGGRVVLSAGRASDLESATAALYVETLELALANSRERGLN